MEEREIVGDGATGRSGWGFNLVMETLKKQNLLGEPKVKMGLTAINRKERDSLEESHEEVEIQSHERKELGQQQKCMLKEEIGIKGDLRKVGIGLKRS